MAGEFLWADYRNLWLQNSAMNLYPEDAFLLQVLKLCGCGGTVMMYFTLRILIFGGH